MENHNQNLNILVLDDEKPALSYMVETIEDVQQTTALLQKFKVLSTNKQNEFWKILKEKKPQIIFLDIQMPEKSGIEIANEIRMNKESLGYSGKLPLIVFSTAFENYGYKAFQVDAVDYVLKPIDNDKIIQVFEKIQANYSDSVQEVIDTIRVPTNGIEVDLPLKDVLYFKADMKYINVCTAKKEYLINTTLLNLEALFPSFVKIHRAYLVNPIYISRFTRKENHWFLSLKGIDYNLPVSRRQRQEIEKKLNFSDLFNLE